MITVVFKTKAIQGIAWAEFLSLSKLAGMHNV
jgi:hypothetical protein